MCCVCVCVCVWWHKCWRDREAPKNHDFEFIVQFMRTHACTNIMHGARTTQCDMLHKVVVVVVMRPHNIRVQQVTIVYTIYIYIDIYSVRSNDNKTL